MQLRELPETPAEMRGSYFPSSVPPVPVRRLEELGMVFPRWSVSRAGDYHIHGNPCSLQIPCNPFVHRPSTPHRGAGLLAGERGSLCSSETEWIWEVSMTGPSNSCTSGNLTGGSEVKTYEVKAGHGRKAEPSLT